jgi:hypothetical protein
MAACKNPEPLICSFRKYRHQYLNYILDIFGVARLKAIVFDTAIT